jgi:hypothetical protein
LNGRIGLLFRLMKSQRRSDRGERLDTAANPAQFGLKGREIHAWSLPAVGAR